MAPARSSVPNHRGRAGLPPFSPEARASCSTSIPILMRGWTTALTVARLTARRVASSARVKGPVLYNNFSTRERFARPTSEEFSSQSSGADPSRPVDSSAIMDPAYPQPPEFVALSNKLA